MGKNKAESSWKQKYVEINQLGEGGNAKVFLVKDSNGKEYAIKELSNRDEERISRFKDEIKVMTDNKCIPGIMPIIEFDVAECWYVMPKADSLMSHLNKASDRFQEIQNAIKQLTETLSILQFNNIAHRDIKPDNLYFYDDRYCYGDFGLVDFPDHIDGFTRTTRNLGAKFTMAPEMMRHPKDADGLRADIYSLAKTFWMLFTKDTLGFDGRYNYLDTSIGLRYREEFRGKHLAEIELLLNQSTCNAPEDRPTIDEFCRYVSEWIEISENDRKSQESDWRFAAKLIFGEIIPQSASWINLQDIVKILQIVALSPAYNHMLFSSMGGLDLRGIYFAAEEGWLDLNVDPGSVYRVKPKRLYFEGFDEHTGWNYFRLELEGTDHVLDTTYSEETEELLTEDYPGHYVDPKDSCYGVYDYDKGDPLPEGARNIIRITRGVLLIVMKSGGYNSITATYDGRHGDCNNSKFREYIEYLIAIEEQAKKKGVDSERILNHPNFSKNPFKKQNIDDSKIDLQIAHEKEARKFIDENVKSWKFPIADYESESKESSQIYYYFSYGEKSWSLMDGLASGYILCKDGFILENSMDNFDKCLLINSIEEIVKLKSRLDDFVLNKLDMAGIEIYERSGFFDIEFRRGKVAPTHLFTKAEMKDKMQKADDRRGNVLVIDANGYVQIVPDDEKVQYYPACLESWNARNNYVGKYSSLEDLDEAYLRALEGWLQYLSTGRHAYSDYTDLKDDAEIIKKIMEYYDK